MVMNFQDKEDDGELTFGQALMILAVLAGAVAAMLLAAAFTSDRRELYGQEGEAGPHEGTCPGLRGGIFAADPIRRKRGSKRRMGVALQSSFCRTSVQTSIRVNPRFEAASPERHFATAKPENTGGQPRAALCRPILVGCRLMLRNRIVR